MSSFVDFAKTAGGGSVIGAASGSILSGVSSALQARKQYQRQKKLMRMQQEYQTKERESSQTWQERMWNLQNLYNSPKNQMQLLEDGGLSPDLMYSKHGVSAAMGLPSSTNSGAPSVPTPAGEASSIDAADHFSNAALKAAQARNLYADTKKKETETDYTNILADHEGKKIMLTGSQIDFTNEQKEYVKAKTAAAFVEADKLRSAIQVDNSIVALNNNQLRELLDTFKDRFNQIRLSNRSLELQNKLSKSELDHYEEFIESTIELINDQALAAQQSGKSLMLQNLELQKIQEARFRIKSKMGDVDSDYYDIMTNLTLAYMTGDTEMIQKQAELLQRFGAWKTVTDPIISALGIATGAYVGARTARAQPKNNRLPIGFNK